MEEKIVTNDTYFHLQDIVCPVDFLLLLDLVQKVVHLFTKLVSISLLNFHGRDQFCFSKLNEKEEMTNTRMTI